MSAYLLSNEQFQLIANGLFQWRDDASIGDDIAEFVTSTSFSTTNQMENPDEWANGVRCCLRTLYNLNRLALTTRYGDEYKMNDKADFSPNRKGVATPSHVEKKDLIETLECLRYQCAEYLIVTTTVYKDLRLLILKLKAAEHE